MPEPRRFDIKFTQGDGWAQKFAWSTRTDGVKTPRNVTTSTWLAQIRKRAGSDEILATITVRNHNDIDALATNEIVLSLTADQTRLITRDSVWDLQETASGAEPQTKFSGKVFSKPDVSRT